ncbi:hypothetical protein BASA60_011174, partial [Batrachochytrium salamandrivorans]
LPLRGEPKSFFFPDKFSSDRSPYLRGFLNQLGTILPDTPTYLQLLRQLRLAQSTQDPLSKIRVFLVKGLPTHHALRLRYTLPTFSANYATG